MKEIEKVSWMSAGFFCDSFSDSLSLKEKFIQVTTFVEKELDINLLQM